VGGRLGIDIGWGLSSLMVAVAGVGIWVVVIRVAGAHQRQSCLVWCSGSERGGDRGVTYLGCIQWGLVVVVGGNAGAGR